MDRLRLDPDDDELARLEADPTLDGLDELVVVQAGGSYLAAADRLHLHKKTVKYRVDKALAARGRPIGEERLDMELALVACRWLGESVLR